MFFHSEHFASASYLGKRGKAHTSVDLKCSSLYYKII
jgi:hypothetical protein